MFQFFVDWNWDLSARSKQHKLAGSAPFWRMPSNQVANIHKMRGDERDVSWCVNEGQLFGFDVSCVNLWHFNGRIVPSTTNLAMYNNEQTVLVAWYRSKIMNRAPVLSIKVLQLELVFWLSRSSGQDQENNNSVRVLEKVDVIVVYTPFFRLRIPC